MKSRTKSTKPAHTLQTKPRNSHQFNFKTNKISQSLTKKEHSQVHNYLQMSFQLLQTRLKLPTKAPSPNSANILQLSSILYKTIKQNIPQKNYHQRVSSNIDQKSSRRQIESDPHEKQICPQVFRNRPVQNQNATSMTINSFNNSTSDLQSVHYVRQGIPEKQKMNSKSQSILDYFKEKFGSPVKDEQQAEKKLNKIKMLKRTQQFINKYTSESGRQNAAQNNSKSLIMDKIRQKNKDKARK